MFIFAQSLLFVLCAGHNQLGGVEFDVAILNAVSNEVLLATGIDVDALPKARAKLLAACKEAKENLSTNESVCAKTSNLQSTNILLDNCNFVQLDA